MKKEENMVNFDLSQLDLSELVILYEKITTFLQFLDGKSIEIDEGDKKND